MKELRTSADVVNAIIKNVVPWYRVKFTKVCEHEIILWCVNVCFEIHFEEFFDGPKWRVVATNRTDIAPMTEQDYEFAERLQLMIYGNLVRDDAGNVRAIHG